jgi:hypothetical protein
MKVYDIKGNQLGFPHALCANCDCNTFYIETSEGDNPVFKFLICTNCGDSIAVNLKPVWGNE